VSSAVRFEFAIVAIAQQRVVVRIRFQINTAAVPAIAARRASARHELLSPKRDAPVAAVSRFHQYFSFVNKHGMTPQENWMQQIAGGLRLLQALDDYHPLKTRRRSGTRRTASVESQLSSRQQQPVQPARLDAR
jgi:hypothetical protein